MVKSRVAKEVNLQPLFLRVAQPCCTTVLRALPQFLDALSQNKLIDFVTQSTFTLLHLLLADDALDMAVVSPAHRTALKNLGHWLGCVGVLMEYFAPP